MRKFVRHPSDFPADVRVLNEHQDSHSVQMKNISKGGMSCEVSVPIFAGSQVEICVPSVSKECFGCGEVAWCRPGRGHFQLGVRFGDAETAYRARMVEQICQIEAYRRECESREGRFLAPDQAAEEWIELYAEDFDNQFTADDNGLRF
ncbi:PilZ domain-containing protein [Spongiibacter sp. KMU-158]|uniref:PilZ domain-containing protein n=1 Tax=Spongiibacter pelagi TaxID=2760804 RepID=A0A927C3J1_9GAMM|nr:PilZ domain-containing protein [Spongiibacter pelagi]MBD2858971.1 PilZ domain-containing protein [Spongiibacter pelagi]